ncbi:hypothetical protein ACSYG7_13585 [Bacillus velezensis]|uniref:hypothetical protein n=2 Tax=Bacillus amyloliquefaciens group TaxID=1938374 RepID=UPI001EF0D8E7|nr:hypothetical protein [Bacillus velezensis]ULH21330.1 hypothetical protein MF598_06605 [Bacillus velezensis]UUT26280.1 hypothetical protein NRF11_13735 [Bacillus velezensis]
MKRLLQLIIKDYRKSTTSKPHKSFSSLSPFQYFFISVMIYQNIRRLTEKMTNFSTEKFKIFLNSMSNPSDSKIRDYYSNQEFAAFNIDFENVEIALRIAGILGKSGTHFDITNFCFPDTNEIDYIQFMVFKINDPELLTFLDQI